MTATVDSAPMLMLDTEKMRARREALGLKQRDAAERAGMGLTRWNDIETGKRVNVTVETLGLLTDALECEPGDILSKVKPAKRAKGKK